MSLDTDDSCQVECPQTPLTFCKVLLYCRLRDQCQKF